MAGYLEDLTLRLAHGIAEVPETLRQRHARFFLDKQRPDGGFAGREGPSDLYYTGFGLRGLALLGELHGRPAERAAEFLAGRMTGHAPLVDFVSLLFGAALLEVSAGIDVFAQASPLWRGAVADELESLRRADGGYAKSYEGAASSTYHTFLVLLARQLTGGALVDPQRMVEFILSQRRDDGGFVEIRPMRSSGTNPTAAAIGALKVLGQVDGEIAAGAVGFLLEDTWDDEGGFRANTRIPIPDVLSTFTALVTLADLGALAEVDRAVVQRWARSLEQSEGGFLAAAWDGLADVEYSFYGLGVLALTAGKA
jgi:geranylgeranyl transferase type-2 subunit beta